MLEHLALNLSYSYGSLLCLSYSTPPSHFLCKLISFSMSVIVAISLSASVFLSCGPCDASLFLHDDCNTIVWPSLHLLPGADTDLPYYWFDLHCYWHYWHDNLQQRADFSLYVPCIWRRRLFILWRTNRTGPHQHFGRQHLSSKWTCHIIMASNNNSIITTAECLRRQIRRFVNQNRESPANVDLIHTTMRLSQIMKQVGDVLVGTPVCHVVFISW